ncbi:hypothetical protein [Kitasatospora aureofaciens]|uniref:hypothetical protein n=1 Tax=Kitasatospora aureofaciens TaxID=1894 RepID=UPI001C47B2DA|nr:hypothetical protein [Kitasatospora aureofaciens]MBV6702473.1 hypothetical protein [Kitasatospora aureofaciens]
MTRLRHRPALDVRVEIRGELPREDGEYVRAQALDLVAVPGHYGLITPVADGG